MSFLIYKVEGLEEEVDMCVARLGKHYIQVTHLLTQNIYAHITSIET